MAGQICPACGCVVVGGGYEKGGKVYCCQPYAEQTQCACGCCTIQEASSQSQKEGNKGKADRASK